MNTNEANRWVHELLAEIAGGKQYKRLVQQCLNNMGENKKLYKYYDLDAVHTFDNVENAINYYQDPAKFNDPFDCNIGISTDQIIRILFPELIEKALGKHLDPVAKKLLETILWGENVDYDTNEKYAIISSCLKNVNFQRLVDRANAGAVIDDTEIVNILISDPSLLAAAIKNQTTFQCDPAALSQVDEIANVAMQSVDFVRMAINKASENQDEQLQTVLAIMGEKEDFLIRIGKIAKLLGYDISSDKIEQLYNQLDNIIYEMHCAVGRAVGITCFSETHSNMLMWSHYANKHTGICVEYDFSKLFTTVPTSLLLPVTYSDKRPLLPIERIVQMDGDCPKTDNSKMHELLPDLLRALTVKSSIWDYEREWRHIVFTKDVPDRLAKLPIISRIILGARISPEHRAKILELARKKQIPVTVAKMKADRYEMIFTDI